MEQQKINRVTQEEYDYLLRQYEQAQEYENESWLPRRTEAHKYNSHDLLYTIRRSVIIKEEDNESRGLTEEA